MTKSKSRLSTQLTAITDDLPQPDIINNGSSSETTTDTGLPRPTRRQPETADSGRIKFGAAMRLPTNK